MLNCPNVRQAQKKKISSNFQMSRASQNWAYVSPADVHATPTTASPSNLQNFQRCIRNILQMVKLDNNSPDSLAIQTMLQVGLSTNECLLKYFEQVENSGRSGSSPGSEVVGNETSSVKSHEKD